MIWIIEIKKSEAFSVGGGAIGAWSPVSVKSIVSLVFYAEPLPRKILEYTH